LSDKSELDELLDNARKEKDQLESEMSYLKEQLARSKNEIEKLKEQVLVLQVFSPFFIPGKISYIF